MKDNFLVERKALPHRFGLRAKRSGPTAAQGGGGQTSKRSTRLKEDYYLLLRAGQQKNLTERVRGQLVQRGMLQQPPLLATETPPKPVEKSFTQYPLIDHTDSGGGLHER